MADQANSPDPVPADDDTVWPEHDKDETNHSPDDAGPVAETRERDIAVNGSPD